MSEALSESQENATVSGYNIFSQASSADCFGMVCTILSCGIAGYQIIQHLRHYHQPAIQLQIIRILSMIPVYQVATLLSIFHPEWTLICNMVRDIYEAYVLYIFMQLLVQFLGGESQLIVHLEFKRRIKQPWPLDKLRPLQTDKVFYRRVKQGVLQFVLIKPITSVLAIVLDRYDLFCDGTYNLHCGFPWLAFLNNLSVSLSLYFLVLFYKATEERLAPFSPFYKFVTVKAILFFSFWQSCLFQILSSMDVLSRDTGNVMLNLIISLEMIFAAIGQSMAFSYQDFADARILSPKTSFQSNHNRNQQGLCEVLGQVLFSTRDVIDDAHSTFIKDVDEEKDKQLQLDELKRAKNSAFNWSDEELLGDMDDLTNVVYKDKYQKPKRKGGSSTTYYGAVKQKVKQGYTAAKAGISKGTTITKEELMKKKQFTADHDDADERKEAIDEEQQASFVTTQLELRRLNQDETNDSDDDSDQMLIKGVDSDLAHLGQLPQQEIDAGNINDVQDDQQAP